MATKQQDDPDIHKGAVEGDRPTDEQHGNPQGDGIDENGLPQRSGRHRRGRSRRERGRNARGEDRHERRRLQRTSAASVNRQAASVGDVEFKRNSQVPIVVSEALP